MRDQAMTLLSELSEHRDPQELGERLRGAHVVTAGLMSEIVGTACRRFPSMGQSGKSARIERLISSEAWTDVALAILGAFVEAERISTPASRPSVPTVSRAVNPIYEPVCCDNFS